MTDTRLLTSPSPTSNPEDPFLMLDHEDDERNTRYYAIQMRQEAEAAYRARWNYRYVKREI